MQNQRGISKQKKLLNYLGLCTFTYCYPLQIFMVSNLTHLSSKDLQFLQPHRSASWAERQLAAIKDAFNSRVVLVKHLASFWSVEDSDIIAQLRPRFSV